MSSDSSSSLEFFNGAGVIETSSLKNLRLIEANDQIRELQTVIRDKYVHISAVFS